MHRRQPPSRRARPELHPRSPRHAAAEARHPPGPASLRALLQAMQRGSARRPQTARPTRQPPSAGQPARWAPQPSPTRTRPWVLSPRMPLRPLLPPRRTAMACRRPANSRRPSCRRLAWRARSCGLAFRPPHGAFRQSQPGRRPHSTNRPARTPPEWWGSRRLWVPGRRRRSRQRLLRSCARNQQATCQRPAYRDALAARQSPHSGKTESAST